MFQPDEKPTQHPTGTRERNQPYRRVVSHMPASTAAQTDRDAFLDTLLAVNILTPYQYAKARTLAATGSAANAATALVNAGLITRFQADRLLNGRSDGFVLGQYIVLELVGRGAMSRVYKAKHRTMNRYVAIKVLSTELTRTAADRETLQTEIRAAGRLTHPNLVTAYDANEHHDRFYLVLEFVDGPSLEMLVQQHGPLQVAEACAFIHQIAMGLQHAHEKGMIHRAIKPANLLATRPSLSAPLAIKITDFGIPRLATSAVDFCAPEQLVPSEVPLDHRADLYSLGCVFFFLLTGWPPFAGGKMEEKVRRHMQEEAPPINQLRPDVPTDVAAIIQRLLAKHPDERFSSAAEVQVHMETMCAPAVVPLEGGVNFDLQGYPVQSGHDTGYLTGRIALSSISRSPPGSGIFSIPPAESSPWSQLTDEVAQGDTIPLHAQGDTPALPQQQSKRPERQKAVPIWMTAFLLISAVLLSLMGIIAAVRLLAK